MSQDALCCPGYGGVNFFIGRSADALLIEILELKDLKAYGTLIIGLRLNYGTERNDTELFIFH